MSIDERANTENYAPTPKMSVRSTYRASNNFNADILESSNNINNTSFQSIRGSSQSRKKIFDFPEVFNKNLKQICNSQFSI